MTSTATAVAGTARTAAGAPQANTSRNTLETIAAWVQAAGGTRVLDIPCGEGALLALLAGDERVLTGGDVQPDLFKLDGVPCRRVDLQAAWPFGDAEFDTVVCADGIEHVENPFHVVREARRVLAPGGRLILSTPNINAVRSRWRFLWSGFHNKFKRPLDERARDPLHHINPMGYPELRYVLHTEGFALERVGTNRIKAASWPYAVLYPVAAVYSILALRHDTGEAAHRRNADVFRHMMSPAVFLGETLILQARKGA